MKKLLAVVLWLLPAMLFAQSPFDGTWKTNMAESKLSQKPVRVFGEQWDVRLRQLRPQNQERKG